MAGRGPAPKGTRSRARDERRDAEATVEVAADGALHGPDLPDDREWPAATVLWWKTWRESAQAHIITATGWQSLLATALIHADVWSGNLAQVAELRLREAKFGATPEDMARLRLTVSDPKGKRPSSESAPAPARRERLLKAVNDGA